MQRGQILPEQIPGPLGRKSHWRSVWARNFQPFVGILRATLPRFFDLILVIALLLVIWPVVLLRAGLARLKCGQVFQREIRVGRFRTLYQQLDFAGQWPGKHLAQLFNILRGELAFVGPRPLRPEECGALPAAAQARFSVRPGLISTHRMRQGTGIAHDQEYVSDVEFAYAENLKGNVSLLMKGVAIGALKGGHRPTPAMLDFFGVRVVNTTMDEAISWILQHADSTPTQQMAFVNPDCLNIAYRHAEYRAVLQKASRVLPDGIGIHIGCRILGTSLRANVNGTDLFPRLCAALNEQPSLSLFLLGARPGIADLVAQNMQARFPTLRIAGTHHGYFDADDDRSMVERINQSGANILLVAFGAPRQELWLAQYREQLHAGVVMGVGGLFDFYSGRISRAPLWLRELGLEWTWRLLQEPRRMWRRYVIGNPLFLIRVLRQARQERSA